MEILKKVWDEDRERCYSLYRIAGKTVRIRGVFGRRFIAEIFSPALLRWELLTLGIEPIPEHTPEHVKQISKTLLDEVKLILDGNRINAQCICPLCGRDHDPKLIGDGGEGKDD